MLAAYNITKRYPNGTEALRGVSLTLAHGVTAGLMGESGCGKSTLARIMCRLETPSSGRVTIDGSSTGRLFRRRVQIVFQDTTGALDPKATIEQILSEPLGNFFRFSRTEMVQHISELLYDVGLDEAMKKKYPHQISGGQRQRVAIARALAAEPEYLLCDEVISGIDAEMRGQILALLRELCGNRGVGCLFITHDPSLADKMCDTIFRMNEGKINDTVGLFYA